ncbi:channel protein TolC [Noviherbaspirillum cavernae]|uniref:Channel protein TolC n=1 Tax=Noviherbaspirillum cavernae TaxID=2320862 RepID=A0A418WY25_9BURK|nr:TolC family outer membrane protein [Noviherbaspirillum cavernae]RJG05130.1 channel protein TolC [Noviherbaspirillum cavernae]
MRKSTIATLTAGAFLSMNAYAINLVQVYQEALANDAPYASSRATLTAGQEKSVQGRAGLLPTVGLTANATRTNLPVDFLPDRNSRGYTLSLSQPLFNIGNWENYQKGNLSAAFSEAQFAQAQQDLIVRVAQAYFDVLTAQDTLASVQAQKVAITEQLAAAKRNFEVGTTTITDSQEAQARYDLTLAQEFAAQSDLEIRRNALQQIIGKPAGELASLRPGMKINSPEPAQIEKWVDSAEQQNYSVLQQQLALESAKHDIKLNRAGHYPTVTLVASRNYDSDRNVSIGSGGSVSVPNTNSIGVQVAVPIFSGFTVTSKVRESIALEDKARSDLENVRRTAAQGARQAFLGVNSGLAQVRALEAAEVSSQSALDSNRLGYQVGVRINIDVLNAQQQLYTTRQNLAKARYDTIMNGLKLKSAAGTLKEEDLAQVNALLQH